MHFTIAWWSWAMTYGMPLRERQLLGRQVTLLEDTLAVRVEAAGESALQEAIGDEEERVPSTVPGTRQEPVDSAFR